MAVFNITELKNGTNIAEWLAIVNQQAGGFLFGGLIILIFVIIYGISAAAKNEQTHSFLGASFACFLISGIGWLIKWNSQPLISGFFPVAFLFLAGISTLFVVIDYKVSQ